MVKESFQLETKNPIEILEVGPSIGKGNYGSVFIGKNIVTKNQVAIKVVKWDASLGKGILVEVDILKQCKHPNIIECHQVFLHRNQLWMELEYCEHGSLLHLINAYKRGLSEEQISVISGEVLRALDYLHERNIVHRDIKCDNILINSKGQVKIADFGVAMSLGEGTKTQTIIGTPFWMAPEVICSGDESTPYGHKCDIWSFGITLIEMAEMKTPFNEYHPARAIYLIVTSDPPTLTNPKKFSKELNDLISACLVKDPEVRPSAKDISNHSFLKMKKARRHGLSLNHKKTFSSNKIHPELRLEPENTPIDQEPTSFLRQDEIFFGEPDTQAIDNASNFKKESRISVAANASEALETVSPLPQPSQDATLIGRPKVKPLQFVSKDLNLASAGLRSPPLMNSPQKVLSRSYAEGLFCSQLNLQSNNNYAKGSKMSINSAAGAIGNSSPNVYGNREPRNSIDHGNNNKLSLTRDISRHNMKDEGQLSEINSSESEEEEEEIMYLDSHMRRLFSPTSIPLPESIQGCLQKMEFNFPFEITCVDIFAGRYLLGTACGLYSVGDDGQVKTLIPKKSFSQIKVVESLGILLALCGKTPEIRLYGLIDLSRVMKTDDAPLKKYPVIKMKQTSGCRHFELNFINNSWFLLATLKKSVILYLWDNFPHYKFMIVKEWRLKEKPVRSMMVVEKKDPLSKICIQLADKYVFGSVTSDQVNEINFSSKSKPKVVTASMASSSFSSEILCGFSDSGFLVNSMTGEQQGATFEFKTSATSLVSLRNYVVNFGQKSIEIHDKATGNLLERALEFKKITLLFVRDDVVFFSAKAIDGTTSVYALDL